jgi:nuclear pore complex protein Nup43
LIIDQKKWYIYLASILKTVWDVVFHPSYPNHLFTCSEDGAVWHWNAGAVDSTPVFGSKGNFILAFITII